MQSPVRRAAIRGERTCVIAAAEARHVIQQHRRQRKKPQCAAATAPRRADDCGAARCGGVAHTHRTILSAVAQRGQEAPARSRTRQRRLPATAAAAAADAQPATTTTTAPAPAPADGALTIEECEWPWRWGSSIRYLKATAGAGDGPVLLLLHGFGVGGYHFERVMRVLAASPALRGARMYAPDLLGQGSSWPAAPAPPPDPELGPLCYSADVWGRQLLEFATQVAGAGSGGSGGSTAGSGAASSGAAGGGAPIYVVGNSLGGFLATHLAAEHPELVKGLVLLNAAPFWGFRPAQRSSDGSDEAAAAAAGDSPDGGPGPAAATASGDGLLARLRLDGAVPVQPAVRAAIERLWWRNLSSPDTVGGLLRLVYARPVDDERLLARILEATEHPAAIDAFSSIVLSPKSKRSFDESVAALAVPTLLLHGAADPWVVPLWGQRFKRAVPHAAYYELRDVGHCPHHEAPNAVGRILADWIAAAEQRLAGGGSGGGEGAAAAGAAAATAASTAAATAAADGGAGDPLLVSGPLRVGESLTVREAHGGDVEVTHVTGAPRNAFERLDFALFRVRQWFARRRRAAGGDVAGGGAR